jgi:hypothetical protein
MSDLSNYRTQVTEYGKRANEAEKAERFEEAYSYYMQALDIFMHLIKCKYSLHNKLRREELTAC